MDSNCPDKNIGCSVQLTNCSSCSSDLDNRLMTTVSVEDTLSVAELAEPYIYYQIGSFIHRFCLPIIISVGVIGNTLSFIVMMKTHNRHNSCCILMASLALSDNIMLCGAGFSWLSTMNPQKILNLWECQVIIYVYSVISVNGVYLVVTMTLDRYIAIRFPMKAKSICTAKRAKLSVIAIFIFAVVLNLPFLPMCLILEDGRTCTANKIVHPILSRVFSFTVLCLVSVIPFTIMLVFNALIIKTMQQRDVYFEKQIESNSKENQIPGHSSPSLQHRAQTLHTMHQTKSNTDKQLVIMLLTVSFAFLILTLPNYVVFVTFLIVDYKRSPLVFALYNMIFNIVTKMYYSNSSVNFFLFCISGSKFRSDLHETVKKATCRPTK